jgi:hypothetical protein
LLHGSPVNLGSERRFPRSRGVMWRTLRQRISETGNYQLQAMGELEECRSIAVEMQRYRASYRLLEQISQESSNEEYRDQAKRA